MMTLLPMGVVQLQVKTLFGKYFILAIDPHYMVNVFTLRF